MDRNSMEKVQANAFFSFFFFFFLEGGGGHPVYCL